MSASRYAYLGPEGTFTEAALRSMPEAATRELVPMVSVPVALDAVRSGAAAAALVANGTQRNIASSSRGHTGNLVG
ncbi:hypothetical protein SANTM175S_07614 [Streptomyces antimycoticus]